MTSPDTAIAANTAMKIASPPINGISPVCFFRASGMSTRPTDLARGLSHKISPLVSSRANTGPANTLRITIMSNRYYDYYHRCFNYDAVTSRIM